MTPPTTPKSTELTAEQLAAMARQLRRYLYGLTGNWAEAEDVTQEALLKAWRGRDGFAGRSSLRTWLFAIAKNTFRDRLRRKSTRPEYEEMTPATLDIADSRPGPSERLGRGEFQAAFAQAMDQLPQDQRHALALRQSGQMSFAEIAEVLDVPLATAKSRVRYALLKLADLLAPYRQELNK